MTPPLHIGQRWRTRGGFIAHIHAHNDSRDRPASSYPYVVRAYPNGTDSEPHYYTVNAFGCHFGKPPVVSAFDLSELLEDVPAATPTCGPCDCEDCKPTAATPALDALAGIGDVNSTAKGSGARYNTGKTPYELVPLRILGESFLMRADSPAGEDAARALIYLGAFQERAPDASDQLHWIFDVMGRDGWQECAGVFDYGRRKYAEWNWAKGMPWSVPLACAARHLKAICEGEAVDPESQRTHRGHAFCNVVMLLVYLDTFPEGDDRPAAGMLRMVEAA